MRTPNNSQKADNNAASADPLSMFDSEPGVDQPQAVHDVGAQRRADTSEVEFEITFPEDEPSEAIEHALSLESVLDARTPVHWVEAVAILERACAALIHDDGSESVAPEPSGIFIDHQGLVTASEGSAGASSVNRLGRTLHALASAGPMPVPLRLLVTTWIETKEHHSIESIRRELSHFVRPDGQALIKAVYERCATPAAPRPVRRLTPVPKLESPARAQTQNVRAVAPAPHPVAKMAMVPPEVSTTDEKAPTREKSKPAVFLVNPDSPAPKAVSPVGAAEPVPVAEPAAAANPVVPVLATVPAVIARTAPAANRLKVLVSGLTVPPALRRVPARKIAKGAAIAATVIALVAVGYWVLSSMNTTAQATESTTASAAPIAPIPFGKSIELPNESGASRPAPARPAGTRSTAARPAGGAPIASTRPADLVARTLNTARPAAPPTASTPAPARVPNTGAPASSLSVLAARPPAAVAAPAGAAARVAGRVYTSNDREVEPPIMVYPQVRPGTIGGAESDFNTMEIVVSERGLVEQVRLLTTPKRMTDMMLLSGAKTWRFEPASVDGAAVRYRMAITWPTTR